jgi:predicted glutamine amidotransferase
MCLLVFAHKGATPSLDSLETASIANPDGFGWAINIGDRIVRGRGMNFDKVVTAYHQQLELTPGESMFHLRWATHGTVNKKNCHPFYVGHDDRTVLGHNGIIPIEQPKGDKRSDTRFYAEVVLPKLGGAGVLDDPEAFQFVEKQIGASKLVILTNDPRAKQSFYIANEQMGHWDSGGVWWSNDSYKPRTYTYKPTTNYSWSWESSPSIRSHNSRDLYDEWDDNIWVATCPLCDVQWKVDESKGETACPDCDVCLVCEEFDEHCTCSDSWYSNSADDRLLDLYYDSKTNDWR